jgi:hypothetical protein
VSSTRNFDLFRKNTKTLNVTVLNAAGTAVNLTGAAIKWWLSKNPHSSGDDVLILKEIGEGISIVSAVAGTIEIVLGSADTDLPPGLYYHELKIFSGSSETTSMRGIVYMRSALNMPSGDSLQALNLTITSPQFGTPVVTVL